MRRVIAASHHGDLQPGRVIWRSTYALEEAADEGSGEGILALAYPLPPGSTLAFAAQAAPVVKDGRIVGLRSATGSPLPPRLEITVNEPPDGPPSDDGRGKVATLLVPPLAAGDAVQVVDVVGTGDVAFEPDARLGLERHIGYFASPILPARAREMGDAAVSYARGRATIQPVYVQATELVIRQGGLAGFVTTDEFRLRSGAIGAGVLFVVILVALFVAYRTFARTAKVEHAERVLDEEFSRLGRD